MIFRAKNEVFNTGLKSKTSDRKLLFSHPKKYPGVYIDGYINWSTDVNQLQVKVTEANVILSNIQCDV